MTFDNPLDALENIEAEVGLIDCDYDILYDAIDYLRRYLNG